MYFLLWSSKHWYFDLTKKSTQAWCSPQASKCVNHKNERYALYNFLSFCALLNKYTLQTEKASLKQQLKISRFIHCILSEENIESI